MIAFGGNALLQNGDIPNFNNQYKRAYSAMSSIADIVSEYEAVITHGNGPQVGNILLQNEIAEETLPKMPLHTCGAMSQGLIAETILLAYDRIRSEKGISKEIASVIGRTLVSETDPAFSNPSKPVGPFYTAEKAEYYMKNEKWPMREFPQKGWRRLVASPEPLEIIEKRAIMNLLLNNFIPLSVGGGGIPVIRKGNAYQGVDAVIDKDLASSVLASDIGADTLLILTDVDSVYVDFNKPTSKALGRISSDEMQEICDTGQFEEGSMGPKVLAAMNFIRKGGQEVHITSLDNGKKALKEGFGTTIFRN